MASGSPHIGGSGKIRTRCCHPGPVTPYSQGRRRQLGVLSSVTECLQNNVPAWLQRYFNKNKDVCSRTTDAKETPCSREIREGDQVKCASEESSNINDGRITSEPTVGKTEDASTTSPASNYAGELDRPSLRRSHLNFSVLVPPPLSFQLSTSSAFPIGSSLRKEIIDSTSQHGDDNMSTSHPCHFSTRGSNKAMAASKKPSVPPLWSPEAEQSHSLSQHTATRSRKPAFSLSAFGTLSPSFEKSLIFKTSRHGDPPCYLGGTTYGGAAAAVRHSKLGRTPYQAPVRRQMKAKQLNAQSYGVTSLEARRILQSVEKISGPLADVSSMHSPLDRSWIDSTDFGAKRDKVDSQYPVQKFRSPKPVSRATYQSLYFKPSLTPSHELRKANQRIVKNHSTHENSMTPGQNREQESGFPYRNLQVPAPNGLSSGVGSRGGKIRQERTRLLASKPPVKEMEVRGISKLSLPITSSSLPAFSIHCPLMTTSSPAPMSPSQSVTDKVQMISPSSSGSAVFRFSSPTVKSTVADVLPSSSTEFTISMPVAKTELPDTSITSEPIISTSAQDITEANSISHKRKLDEEYYKGPSRPVKTWKEGRVLDVKNPGFISPKVDAFAAQPTMTSPAAYTKPGVCRFSSSGTGLGESLKARSSWRCDTCLLVNKVTDKCKSCQAAKLPPRDTAEQTAIGTRRKSGKPTISASGAGFGDKLKVKLQTWVCDTCLVQNTPEARKCIACETFKPGTGVSRFLPLLVASESAVSMTASSPSCTVTTGALGIGDEFRMPVGSWECRICCVCNNAEDNRCMSCMSKKTERSVPASSSSSVSVGLCSGGGVGLEKLRNRKGNGDCEVCLVQNRADSAKCAACKSAKPDTTGTKSEFKGVSKCSSSSNPAPSCFKLGNSSPSSGPSLISTSTGNFQFGDQRGFKTSVSSDSGSKDAVNRGFQFDKSTKKPRQVPSEVVIFGTSAINHDPAAANTAVTSQSKRSFSFRTVEAKSVSLAPDACQTSDVEMEESCQTSDVEMEESCQTSDVEMEELPPVKGRFASGNMASASVPPASAFTLGGTGEKQQQRVTSATPAYGMKTDKEERKQKRRFPFGSSTPSKDGSCSQLAFGSNTIKRSEKASEHSRRAAFAFGARTNTAADQGIAKPVFSSLNNSFCGSRTSATSAGSGIFANSTPSSNLPVASNHISSSALGNFAGPSTSQSLLLSQQNSTVTAVTPFGLGPGVMSNNTSTSAFISGATTSSSSAGSYFVLGTGPSTPSAGPAFGANQTPTLGQIHGTSQHHSPGFGSTASSTAVFATGSQPAPPPTSGMASSRNQTPVFGQQPSQRAFGSRTTLESGQKTAVKRKK
ncbi:nuclear pore complex protein Nup153-like [Choloepus didactylus]|uniref:nuclear pore complex protein Nup153-like n=1 Tax=Choloepus didactylus TaxID=27675 RepID=UPI0018A006B9|nr:nuclear pore complex protein Nup153-like [Choloepus didactylus]